MRSTWLTRAMRSAALVAVATATLGGTAAAKPEPGAPSRPRARSLFAGSGLLLDANRQVCGLANVGEVCVAFAGSPVGGGGFWPKGTPDQYIFNSGLQLAGIVSPSAGFAWASDTTGAYFFDPRGTQGHGDGVTGIFNSVDPADAAAWPNGAVIRDASLYNGALLGLETISQQDSWVRYWEGDPTFLSGRSHPMGILVEQRSLAWNYPSGNEDIIYFIFTFYNVTARASSGAYNNATIPAAVQAEIAAIGDNFQNVNEARFGLAIPDGGYEIEDMYAGFGMDADVAVFSQNYSTAVLPFQIGTTYTGTFLPEVGWQFPPDVFGAPFAEAPGFVGVKYLRSPESSPGVQVGLTMFSNSLNSGTGFPDAVGVQQLFRYLSGYLGGPDLPCTVGGTNYAIARLRRLCFLATNQADARFFQASGPFVLPPGESRSIVVAYIHAAPLAAPLAALPGGGIGGNNIPGVPFTGDSIFIDPTKVRPIDRVMGWVSESDLDGDGEIEQRGDSGFEIVTEPRSLLDKALVAQAVYDAQFLLPFSPTAPEFYLVPGDNQVTVVWQPSVTETNGDPYFAIASNPASPLYDPNFRQTDVEGYRVYRGRTSGSLELIGQFDYAGSTFTDFTGNFDYGSSCAPELGITAGCPTFPTDHAIAGNVIQVKNGGRVELASGSVLNLQADTAVSGGNSGFPELEDNGVPFAFVDVGVRNSFTYFYTVTAFDVNSFKSGPSSIESPRVTKSTIPRKGAANIAVASLQSGMFGDDNVLLDPSASFGIDAATGKFTGPPPPTNALVGAFAPLVQQLLPALSLEAKIDSLSARTDGDGGCPVSNGLAACYLIYVTFTKDGVPQQFVLNEPWPVWVSFDGITNIHTALGAVPIPADSVSADRFGIPQGFAQFNATVEATLREYIRFSSFEGQAARRGLIAGTANASLSPGGSRWFTGTAETENHPGYGIRVGHLTGVDTVWAPINHTDVDPGTAGAQIYANSGELQCFGYAFAGLSRMADVAVTWGAGGQIASVRDVTHHVNVLFKTDYGASFGFVGDFNGNGYIDLRDFNYTNIGSQWFNGATQPAGLGCAHTDPGPAGRRALLAQPTMLPVSVENVPSAGTGTGFGLYINGERYIFRLTGGTPPAAGTVWTLRTYAGTVRSSTATLGSFTPSGYSYSPTDRNPIIPGLKVVFNVAGSTDVTAEDAATLSNVHTVPDPYYVTSSLEFTANNKTVNFVNLPPQALIRIYSASGILVQVLAHNDPTLGGQASWNLRNRNNQFVASGVYFYHVETPSGQTKVGRFTIVNFAP